MRKNLVVIDFNDEKKELNAEFNSANVLDLLNVISLLATNIREQAQAVGEEEFVNNLIQAASQGKKFLIDDEGNLNIG